jgi:hypothetical protein
MTEVNKDLDINNYTYLEMLKLFNVSNDFNYTNKLKLEDTLAIIKTKLTADFYYFYLKAYKIINGIYALYNQNIILNNDLSQINYFVGKIKAVDSFENYDADNLLDLLDFPRQKEKETIKDDKLTSPNIKEQTNTNSVVNSFVNVVAPGSLNSIKRITHTLNLNINTCFRNNYYNTNPCDFQYVIPSEIKNVISLRLASIEIPNAWYLFSNLKKNNEFMIEINNNGTLTKYVIIVPEGNYDNITLTDYLNSTYFYLSTTSPTDLTFIKFEIDQYSFKSRFKLVGTYPDNFCFTINFVNSEITNIMYSMGWTLGFRLVSYRSIVESIESEAIFDSGRDRYVYMSIDDYQYNNNSLNIVCFDNSIMEKNIIAKIPMVNGKLTMVIVDNTSPLTKTRRYNGPVNIRNLYIRIIDRFGETVNLNNMDYSFTLEMEILYEGFNFKDVNR